MHLKIKQPLSTSTFSGEERGLALRGAGAVRVIVYAPAGQTLVGDFSVKLALRHSATGLFLPFTDDVSTAAVPVMAGQRGVVVGEFSGRGNDGDELVALVTGGTTGGSPLDVEDGGFIYLVLEPLLGD
jgi:hypothetical protein